MLTRVVTTAGRAAGGPAAVLALLGVLASGCTAAAPQLATARPGPGCSARTAQGRVLAGARPVPATVPGSPTAAISTPDGRWVFASLSAGHAGQIAVMTARDGVPRLVRDVPLPPSLAGGFGMALTHDGWWLVVAGYAATAVLSVAALESGRGDPVRGVLAGAGAGAFEVAVSGDDRYLFVSDETSGGLSVFDLAVALRERFDARGVDAGIVPLAAGAVGVALSPGGSTVYVTTFGRYGPHGQLWLIAAARAARGAGRRAVLAHVPAGCQPVRVAVSPDGRTAWVTALQSNALLAFSTAAIRRNPRHAVRAVVRVGSEPVGLALADDGRIALVADSNRGLVAGTGGAAPQSVSVIGTAAALAGRPALLGRVPAGLFPRDVSYDPATGQVLLANFSSGTIEEFPAPRG
ncbi:MAG: YncE family protein [Streptosporangiales bacterium]